MSPDLQRALNISFSSPPVSLLFNTSPLSSTLTIAFFELTEDTQRENYSPLCEKIACLPKGALSAGEEVPCHYVESAKITQTRGLRVIYSTHMHKHTERHVLG